ncbi:phage holin family protein [Paenibacillus illinoisensis]|uniref:phage holin family protein n=1 Tax=Paenibacillus illinoisensis TaxID=59845 RepID=UPI00203AB218|nr:phage holin family protein [Paenibacillus illinoisensis]MCM3208481.1 phage holin family protein [Paenibacillus illinoisensis]
MEFTWDYIFQLIDPALIGVVVACWVIGYGVKQVPNIPNWSIVFIVTAAAIILTGFTLGWSVDSFIQGILTGAFAVYGNQLVQQTKRGVDTNA